ncbi:tektin-2 [Cylas formicarius]|uniref:tektin-2 n=1 Tax=Cylas formicarius TaxID=197179 RepID=UPI002958B10B|nr:tektin-2 [Cylas formicarius]XP_060519917.1 tektin-2 [Cylas formicarius]
MSVITYEKPTARLSLADWFTKQWTERQANEATGADAFVLRHDARQLRNETRIRTDWDTRLNDARLADRVTETDHWRQRLEACAARIDGEMALLADEKFSTEKQIDAMSIPFNVMSECISMRDNRLPAELTNDDADAELKKELCVAENRKRALIERCHAAWEKINKLNEVRFKLSVDIGDKREAIEIDANQLATHKNCAEISHKLDPLRIVKGSHSHATWLEHSRQLKQAADDELADTLKLREALFVARERARNDMAAQRDRVDFVLRRRIFETQKARNEAEWQRAKTGDEMAKLEREIAALEEALRDKMAAAKLAETRLENRSYRPGFELATDEPERGLKEEVLRLRQTAGELRDKIDCAKTTYNALEERMVAIDHDLAGKNQSMTTDVRCLDLRARLRQGEFAGPPTQTDRNIQLTRMEKEIPAE